MELYQIRNFLAVCETLNFTKAAKACNVSQPALTRAIKRREDDLGSTLFAREGKLTHLTPLGQQVKPILENVLRGIKEASARAQRHLAGKEAVLELGVMCTIGPAHVMGLITRLRQQNPGILFDLQEDAPEALLDKLLAGDIEGAVIGMPGVLPERCVAEPLFTEPFVVAFPRGHRFESEKEVALSSLASEDYLLRTGCEYRGQIADKLEESNVSLNVCFRSPREDWVQNMVLAGMGVSLMPQSLVGNPGPLYRPIVAPRIDRQVKLVTVAGRRHSPALRALLAIAPHALAGSLASTATSLEAP